MWLLKNFKTGSIYFVSKAKQHIVSRSIGDLLLTGDNSISRKHAILEIVNNELIITDCGSKYGSFLNENIEDKKQMTSNGKNTLKNNDRIMFGRLGNEWIVMQMKIKTVHSTLGENDKVQLKKDIEILEGEISNEYTADCTHLTMPILSMTMKVLQALIAGIPIVTPKYWKDYNTAMKNNEPLLDYKEYTPKLAETFLRTSDVNFHPNIDRKTIFQGKRFIFMIERHMNSFKNLIIMGGGTCLNLENKLAKSQLIQNNTIVVHYISSSQQSQSQSSCDSIYAYLQKNGKRAIPDCEIGLAILYCSTKKNCNPDVPNVTTTNVNATTIKIQTSKILAKETPLESQPPNSVLQLERCVIPESDVSFGKDTAFNTPFSFESKIHENAMEMENEPIVVPSKRKNDDDLGNVNKKINIEKADQPMEEPSISKQTTPERYKPLDSFLQKRSDTTLGPIPFNKPNISKRKAHKVEEEDDALFSFKTIQKKKVKPNSESSDINNSESSTEFQFKPTNKSQRTTQNSQISLSLLPQKKSKTVEEVIKPPDDLQDFIPLPIDLIKPVKNENSVWLSRSLNKLKIKSEEDVKPDEKTLWIESLKNGFEIKNTIVIKPSADQVDNSTSEYVLSRHNNISNSSFKNFKAFVKKSNFKKQTVVVPVKLFVIE